MLKYIRSTRTTEAQLFKITSNSKRPTDTGHFHSSNHQKKMIPYKILTGKTVYKESPNRSTHIQLNFGRKKAKREVT